MTQHCTIWWLTQLRFVEGSTNIQISCLQHQEDTFENDGEEDSEEEDEQEDSEVQTEIFTDMMTDEVATNGLCRFFFFSLYHCFS